MASEHAKQRVVAQINDTGLQLKQSRLLQDRRSGDLKRALAEVAEAKTIWRAAADHLAAVRAIPTGEHQERLRELHRKVGYLERESEDLERTAATIQAVHELSLRKQALASEIARLEHELAVREEEKKSRFRFAYTAIEGEVRELLHRDLRRQDVFESAREIQFDFGANRISVDGRSYFSASSRVILKSSFILGFLGAATKTRFMRHPRFCILDTIEDKGMEPIRSHNFQHEVVRISTSAQCPHQIIYATAMIAPELDDAAYTVGRKSTRDDPTLRLPRL